MADPFGMKNEFRPSSKDNRKGSGEVKFESGAGGVKSVANPLSINKDSRPGCNDNKPGATRWPMGEGNVKDSVRKNRG